jgi:CrcB protein
VIALWVALGAVVGAPLRYLTDRAIQQRWTTRFPSGTLTVNLVASFVLGLLAGAHDLDPMVAALVGTGFCGALSTWSTFGYETVRLVAVRERAIAAVYVVVSIGAGVALAALGWALSAALG